MSKVLNNLKRVVERLSTSSPFLCLMLTIVFSFLEFNIYNISAQPTDYNSRLQIPEAQIKSINGKPQLWVNDEFVVPFFSFVNSDADNPKSLIINDRQVCYAAKYGNIHLHQVNASVWKEKEKWNFSRLDEALMRVVRNDPDGFILLRIDLSRECLTKYYDSTEQVRYVDGSYGDQVSIASEVWQKNAMEILTTTINYIQDHAEYASRVIGYNFTAGGGREWFQYNFVESGVDVSDANMNRFKTWLENKYKTPVPIDALYDKLQNGWIAGTDRIYYTRADDQEVLDYFDYYNEMVAGVISKFASLIKKATNRKAIVGIYYGYQLELPDARSGHFALNTILSNKDIDFLTSPVCYQNRNEGGIGAEMTLIDAIHSRGKLYLYECDFRSPHNSLDQYVGEGINRSIANHDYLVQVFRRQLGYQILKGTGGWTYDLVGRGWYDHIDFWKEINHLTELYRLYDQLRPPTAPQVVLIVNEEGLKYASDPWRINKYMMNHLRDELYKTSVQFGMYSLNDLLEGRVPESATLYFMVGMLDVDDNLANKLTKILHQKDKTTVWLWDFGQTPHSIVYRLTGISLEKTVDSILPIISLTNDGRDRLHISNDIQYLIEKKNQISFLAPNTTGVEIWGKTGKYPTFVSHSVNGSRQIFYGSYSIKADLIKSLAKNAGVHLFSKLEDPILANSNMVVFHAAEAGEKSLLFPKEVDVYDYYTDTWHEAIQQVNFSADFSETRFFFYGKREDFFKK